MLLRGYNLSHRPPLRLRSLNMLLSRSSLAIAFLSYTVILFPWAIPVDDDSGFLYRFSSNSSNETEELLSWAEVRRLSLR